MTAIGVLPNIIELSASTAEPIFSVIIRWTSKNASVPPPAIFMEFAKRAQMAI